MGYCRVPLLPLNECENIFIPKIASNYLYIPYIYIISHNADRNSYHKFAYISATMLIHAERSGCIYQAVQESFVTLGLPMLPHSPLENYRPALASGQSLLPLLLLLLLLLMR